MPCSAVRARSRMWRIASGSAMVNAAGIDAIRSVHSGHSRAAHTRKRAMPAAVNE